MSEPFRILCFGDSNTYGFDPRFGAADRLEKHERWTGRLDSMPEFEIYNEGMNGREIPHSTWDFDNFSQILQRYQRVDLTVLMLGSNDLFHIPHVEAKDLVERWRRVFAKVPELSGRRILFLAPPAVHFDGNERDRQSTKASLEMGKAYKAFAKEYGLAFADTNDWGITMQYDGVHFSAKGHEMFTKKILPILQHMMYNRENN